MKLPIVSSTDVERVLKKAGFNYAPKRGKGSHKSLFLSICKYFGWHYW